MPRKKEKEMGFLATLGLVSYILGGVALLVISSLYAVRMLWQLARRLRRAR